MLYRATEKSENFLKNRQTPLAYPSQFARGMRGTMRISKQNWGRMLLLATGLCLLVSCAHPVKINEKWGGAALGGTVDLQQASLTWNRLKSGEVVTAAEIESYNQTVRDSVRQIGRNWTSDEASLSALRTDQGQVHIEVDASTIRNAGEVNYLVPADYLKIKRGFEETVKVDGVGSAMVARRHKTPDDPMVPESGLWFPITAILDLDYVDRPVLRLFDPTRSSHLLFPERSFPLAANYSALVARDFQDRQLQILKIPGLLQYQKFEDRMGIRRISSFSPEKRVVVLVHGINSSPATWNETVNKMMADPYIRENCEFWTFGYPTGAPIPYLARAMRKSIREMWEFRQANGALYPDITLVGHSMGGLLSKAVTQSSGEENWRKVFNVSPEELDIPAERKAILQEMFYFEPNPHVKKVIFISTPHRGSDLAEKPVIKLVSDLVQMPNALVTLSSDIFKMGSEVLTPIGEEITRRNPSSIDQLRADSEFSMIFRSMPLCPDVRYYSIIGCTHPDRKPLMDSTDGVVPYSSAHIEGVQSEKVVKSDHGAHKTREGIAEIIRILKIP